MLRSTLRSSLITAASLPHADLLEEESGDLPGSSSSSSASGDEDDDDLDDDLDTDPSADRPPRSHGTILSWSHTDHPGPLGILYTLLALILVHGRSLTDMDMRSSLRQLHLPPSLGSPVLFSSTSTSRCMSTDTFLFHLQRQGYLERRSIGGDAGKPGAGSKRLRATQAPRREGEEGEGADGAGGMFEWRWGPRAMVEVGERGIAEWVGEFMVEGEPVANARAREARVAKMVEGVEKAAGGRLVQV